MLLPLLMSPDADRLLKDEMMNNRILHINAESSRKRTIYEIKKRFGIMPTVFWTDFIAMDATDRSAALLFVILKTYKILFDFHVDVTIRKWNSIAKHVTVEDLMMEFNEISARDAFVDSWKDITKKKVAGAYLTILRRAGMIDAGGSLQPLRCGNYEYYLVHGEAWFLDACLLQKYEIDNIKRRLA